MKYTLTWTQWPVIVIVVALSGCGIPYKSPDIRGSATLDFSSAHGIKSFMFYANGEDCTGNFTLTEKQNPLLEKTKTLVLAANQRVAFNFIWLPSPLTTCQITMSFKPEENGRYALKTALGNDSCYLKILDKNQNNLPVGSNVEFKQMKYVMGMGLRNKCTPMDNPE